MRTYTVTEYERSDYDEYEENITIDDIINSPTTPTAITDMQISCAADLFDWGVEIDETVVIE
mgnify:CR=1 FL=1